MSTSYIRHIVQFGVTLFLIGVAWATLQADVRAVEKEATVVTAKVSKTGVKIEKLTSDVNKQAVTIGQIVVTTKNIEKQLEGQQRLLERILQQLPR